MMPSRSLAALDEVLNNVKDNSSFVAVRAGALRAFFKSTTGPGAISKGDGYILIASTLNKSVRTAERLVKSFRDHVAVLDDMRGTHRSKLCISAHEGVIRELRLYCRMTAGLTISVAQKHVNDVILPNEFSRCAVGGL